MADQDSRGVPDSEHFHIGMCSADYDQYGKAVRKIDVLELSQIAVGTRGVLIFPSYHDGEIETGISSARDARAKLENDFVLLPDGVVRIYQFGSGPHPTVID